MKLTKRCEDFYMETVVKQCSTAPLNHEVFTKVLHGPLRIRASSDKGQRIPTPTSAPPVLENCCGKETSLSTTGEDWKKIKKSLRNLNQPLVKPCYWSILGFAKPLRTSDMVSTRRSAVRRRTEHKSSSFNGTVSPRVLRRQQLSSTLCTICNTHSHLRCIKCTYRY